MPAGSGQLFLCGFGHDIAGLRWQTGAFQLDGGVFNVKLRRGNPPDGVEQALALVQVHVGDPRMQAERIVAAAKRPQVHVVDLLHAFHGEDGAGDFLDLQLMRTAFQKEV